MLPLWRFFKEVGSTLEHFLRIQQEQALDKCPFPNFPLICSKSINT